MAANTSQEFNTIIQGYEVHITQLEEAIRAMFNNNGGAANTAHPTLVQASSIKPNKPQAFMADKKGPKADTWCFQLQIYFKAAQVLPRSKCPWR